MKKILHRDLITYITFSNYIIIHGDIIIKKNLKKPHKTKDDHCHGTYIRWSLRKRFASVELIR